MFERNCLQHIDQVKPNEFNNCVPVAPFHASVSFTKWLEEISTNKPVQSED